MRATVDCFPLLINSAGVKTYLYHWTRALDDCRGGHQLRLFPSGTGATSLHHVNSLNSGWNTWVSLFGLGISNNFRVPMGPLGIGTDVWHASNLMRNPPRTSRLTATIHDVTTWLMPEVHTAANVVADAGFAERVLQKADALIAVSECSRQDAIRVLKLCEDRITTIHHGIPEPYFHVQPAQSQRNVTQYHLNRPFVLSVGTIEPRKNLARLLDAWVNLKRDLRERFDLVVIGMPGWHSEQTIARLNLGVDGVRYLGYVPEVDMPGLTAAATALAYPSLYEGFGFPVAQAMATGTPVVTSNVSSLPEIAGEAAVYADPLSVDSIRGALENVLLSESLRERLSTAGKAQAERFHWSRAAMESWDFFERVTGRV